MMEFIFCQEVKPKKDRIQESRFEKIWWKNTDIQKNRKRWMSWKTGWSGCPKQRQKEKARRFMHWISLTMQEMDLWMTVSKDLQQHLPDRPTGKSTKTVNLSTCSLMKNISTFWTGWKICMMPMCWIRNLHLEMQIHPNGKPATPLHISASGTTGTSQPIWQVTKCLIRTHRIHMKHGVWCR